ARPRPPSAAFRDDPSPSPRGGASAGNTTRTLPPRTTSPRGSSGFPQGRRLHLELALAVRAAHPQAIMTVFVDTLIHLLQINEVAREQALDDLRVDELQRAQARYHPREQDDHEVARVRLHARVLEGGDLVEGGGQTHRPLPVHRAVGADVATRQRERELDLPARRGLYHFCTSMPSCASSSVSIATASVVASRLGPDHLSGQQFFTFQRIFSAPFASRRMIEMVRRTGLPVATLFRQSQSAWSSVMPR